MDFSTKKPNKHFIAVFVYNKVKNGYFKHFSIQRTVKLHFILGIKSLFSFLFI